MRVRIGIALMAVLLWASILPAQQPQPVTYYAEFHVKPGMGGEFMELVKKYNEPTFAKLLQDGTVLAWGVDVPIVHLPDSPTHAIWWAVPDMGALDKVFAAFEEEEMKRKQEHDEAVAEAQRRRRTPPKSVEEQFLEMVRIEKHRDWLLRSLKSKFSEGATPEDFKPYSWITVLKVKPGKASEFRKLLDTYITPTYDKMVEDGSIVGYEMGVEEARTDGNFTHYFWVVMPNLAAREKVRSAFRALSESRSAETNDHIGQSFRKVVDPDSFRTYVVRTIHLRVAAPPQ